DRLAVQCRKGGRGRRDAGAPRRAGDRADDRQPADARSTRPGRRGVRRAAADARRGRRILSGDWLSPLPARIESDDAEWTVEGGTAPPRATAALEALQRPSGARDD